MINGFSILLIIPALNEEKSIRSVLDDVPAEVDKVIVVDNGSTDDTGFIAKDSGAKVVRESHRGYGAACLAGIQYSDQYDIVAFMDADYSDYPSDLVTVLLPLCRKQADFVIGSRSESDRLNPVMTHVQRFGNRLVCRLMYEFIGYCYTDLGPMRAIRSDSLRKLNMTDKDYGWTIEMQIKAVRYEMRIKEVPVRYRARIGQSKISGTIKGSILAGYKILLWTFRSWTIHPS